MIHIFSDLLNPRFLYFPLVSIYLFPKRVGSSNYSGLPNETFESRNTQGFHAFLNFKVIFKKSFFNPIKSCNFAVILRKINNII